jgi:uridine kinase
VAIDGPGGSGKSTLARLLAGGLQEATVIEMDDFLLRSPAPFEPCYDRERLIGQVLEPHAEGRAGRYQRYDWDRGRLAEWHDVPAAGVLLIEGVQSSSSPLRPFMDYSIWVECPYETRLRRGVERDGEELRAAWTDHWMPAEQAYLEAERPDLRADLVLDGGGEAAANPSFRVIGQAE